MIQRLLRRLRPDTEAVHECRNCGTTVDEGDDACPSCGRDEIVTYRFEP